MSEINMSRISLIELSDSMRRISMLELNERVREKAEEKDKKKEKNCH